ncbi:Mycolic acid cyclopropane synthetase-domain-containing protein [Stachybotrys elegans]|uniref:Mycolic acid cyclopropane synthetase-domain-containing protein n=1 Tax=Stachybotrys elegans TaxID=80388 RepID=A0A8K0SJN8_9HYPO|nr:Mycolic acid cyclopropane synthetase-domain-containing protein [Stachybotrys elegans]
MSESWLQSYARLSVFSVLDRIQHGRVNVVCKYLDKSDKGHFTVFGQENTSELTTSIVCHVPKVWDRICGGFDLGIAEAYMMQELDCDNLGNLFSIYLANKEALGFSGGGHLSRVISRLGSLFFSANNNIARARLNASFHYDTSNEHFKSFLSPDLNYSSAIWSSDPAETLETAQRRKVHNILDKAQLCATDHVLDIGCGWGDLDMEAVKRSGCRVTGLTLSSEQKALAEQRIKAVGLDKQIEILLCDYRNAPRPTNGYDCIVSVEMLEHVGDKYMNEYFASISRLLSKQGRMVIQGITVVSSLNGKSSNLGDFLGRYIFPGGYLPTVNQLLASIHQGSRGTLEVEHTDNIGPHYIKTLHCWGENFMRNWDTIRASFLHKNPDANGEEVEHFRRRWMYYFEYCEAGFRSRVLNDYVISAVKVQRPVISGEVKY